MSKRVTFAADSGSSSGNDSDEISLASPPSESTHASSGNLLSPGLSPIPGKAFALSPDNPLSQEHVYTSPPHSDVSSDEEIQRTEPQHNIKINAKPKSQVLFDSPYDSKGVKTNQRIYIEDSVKDTDDSSNEQRTHHDMEESTNLSYLSYINETKESGSVNTSVLNDTSLRTLSFLPDDDHVNMSFSFNNIRQSSNTNVTNREGSKRSEGPITPEKQPKFPKSSPNDLPLITETASLPQSPYFKPGALFTVIIDDKGLPVLVPVVLPEPRNHSAMHLKQMEEGHDRSSFQDRPMNRNVETPSKDERTYHSEHTINQSTSRDHPNRHQNFDRNISPSHRNSKYWKDRLHARSLSSVLGSPYIK